MKPDDARADTLSDIGSDDREPARKVLMRYFRAIAAWNQAYAWLDSSKAFRSPKGVTSLNIVKIQVPKQPKQLATPIRALLNEFLETKGNPSMKQSIKNLEWVDNKILGTIHAEAILMALIKECSKVGTTLPQKLVRILKVTPHLPFNCIVC